MAVVIATGAIASATDLARGKIYNWLTLPMLLAGVVFSTVWDGWSGLGSSLAGAGLGLLLYGWMFFTGFMGAGDVKLLMVFGAWGGAQYVTRVGLLGVFLGGAMALVFLLLKGRLGALLRKLYRFVLSVIVKEMVLEMPQVDKKLTMPFGVSISAAAIWLLLEDPLKKWGIL